MSARPGGCRACATGRTVYRFGAGASRIDAGGEVTALAVEPSGARLAIGHDIAGSGSGFIVAVGGQVLSWRPGHEPVPCGVANQQAVTRIASHPGRALIAAGYAIGTEAGEIDLLATPDPLRDDTRTA
jgi:hypothetical protein